MVSIFTGLGSGFARGSGNLLGGAGQLGSSLLGRGGESVSVNAASGNLLVSRQDEFLVGLGPDVAIGRTYNSLGDAGDGDNGDSWQQSTTRKVLGYNAGVSVQRLGADGSLVTYEWVSGSLYRTKDGSGAFDTLELSGSEWVFTDGDSQAKEYYEAAQASGEYRIRSAADIDGNALTFTYVSGTDKLDKVTTADGSWTQYSWSGSAVTSVTTGYTDLVTSTAKTLTRVRYGYDGQGRLETVTSDLTPGDNSVADNNKYVITYSYHGTSNRIASIAQTDGSLLQVTYDGSNRVETLTQTVASGVTRVTTLAYYSGYTTVTGPDGQVTRLDYDGSQRLTRVTAPPAYSGATAQDIEFSYDADGNLDTVTDAAGEVTSYDYDANGNAVLVTDPTGATVTRTYDAQNRLITELTSGADRDGANVAHYKQYVYDAEGHLRFAVNAAGQTTEYRYGADGKLERTIQYAEHRMTPPGAGAIALATAEAWVAGIADKSSVRVTTYSYDARGNVTQSKSYGIADSAGDPLTSEGSTTGNFVYDQAGNLIESWKAGESHETFLYDGLGRLYSSTDKNGGTVTIVFTDASTTTAVTSALGLTTTSVYNKAGELVSQTEAGASTTVGTANSYYDSAGRLRKVVDATGREAYFYYDKAGRKVAEVNHLGELTEFRYNAAGRLAATIAYSTALGTTQFNTVKNLAATADLSTLLPSASANDIWSWTIYDDAGRVIQRIDNLGSTATFEYDTEGKLAKTYAYFTKLSAGTLSGFKTTLPTTLQLPSTDAKDTFSRVFYNKAGQEIATLDGEGFLTESIRDGAGLVTQTTSYAMATVSGDRASGSLATLKAGITASAANDRVGYSVYDGQGLLRFTVNAEGGITGFSYDGAGRLFKTTVYATKQTLSDFTYDAVKAAAATNAADRISWIVYDAAGRAAYTVDAEGGVTAFAYNSAGQVVKTVGYDNLYASTIDLSSLNSWAANSTQASDAKNRVTRSWYNARGETVYSMDAETFVTGYTYDAEGRVLSSVRYGGSGAAVSDSTTISQLAALLTGTPTTSAITVSTTYDNAGRVLTVTRPFGDSGTTVTQNTYNALGQLYEVTEAYGQAEAVTTRYTYDGAGRVLTVTSAQGTGDAASVTYAYDGLGNRTGVTDARGNAVSYTFDRLGQVLTATDALSGVTAFVYDAFGNVVKTTAPGGDITYSYYDNLDRLTLSVDEEKYITTVSYNRFGEVSSSSTYKTAFSGTPVVGTPPSTSGLGTAVVLTTLTYDRLGRTATRIDAEGYGESYAYNAFGNLVTFRRYPGAITGSVYNETLFEYDERGSLTKTTDAEGFHESYTYDAFGRRVTSIAKSSAAKPGSGPIPAGGTTTYAYYKDGLLKSETLPIQSQSSAGANMGAVVNAYTYDRRGNLTQKVEAQGLAEARTTTYTYDKLNRRLTTAGDSVSGVTIDASTKAVSTVSGAPTETVTYDANGNVIRIVDAAGSRTVFFYDQLNRKTVEVGALGTYTLYTYDADGNVTNIKVYETTVTVPANGGASSSQPAAPSGSKRETSFTYDGRGLLLTSSVVLPSGYKTGTWNGSAWSNATTASLDTAYQYDYLGNAIKVTDPNGNASFSYYDRLGRKTAQVDAEGYLTDWTYNSEGNVLTERRYSTRFTGTPTTASPPSVSTNANDRLTTYTYDKVGNRLTEARSSVVVHNGSGGTSTATSTITYTYNGLGQVVTKTQATGEVFSYTYDAGGRLTQETRPSYTSNNAASVTPTLNYFYNGLGSITRMVQAAGGDATSRVTTYTYGAGGRMSSMTQAVTASDNYTRNYLYDVAGRLVLETYSRITNVTGGGTSTADEGIGYRYDALGRSLGQAFYKKPSSTWIFQSGNDYNTLEYNAFGDVTRIGINGGWQQETKYDMAGRVWASNTGDGIWKYFGYDKNGNQTLSITGAGEAMGGFTFAAIFAKISEDDVNGTYTVFDKRNLATSTVQEGRELTASGTSTLTSSRTYTAFGEVATETDAASQVTTHTYNTMGRLIRSEGPTVSMTQENGAAIWIKASNDFYYDASGRLVASRDANGTYGTGGTSTNGASKNANTGNLTRLTLLAGTGYDDGKGLVTVETHADGGTVTNAYDIHGNLRKITQTVGDGTNLVTQQEFDRIGRLTLVTSPGGLVDYYAYDILGQRIEHWNSHLTNTNKELTGYDVQGRVTYQRSWGGASGDETTTAYVWSGTLATPGLATGGSAYGGWTQTTTYANSKTLIEKSDMFGRTVEKTDLGGNVTAYTYDVAGRLVSALNGTYGSTYTYFNTGQVKQATDFSRWYNGTTPNNVETRGEYTYDAMGRRLTELGTQIKSGTGGGTTTFKNSTTTYDAMGRLKTWQDTIPNPDYTTTQEYDAAGNIRRTNAWHRDMWFRYDNMNRLVTDKGQLSGTAGAGGTTIVRAYLNNQDDDSHEIVYDNLGRRKSVARLIYVPEWGEWDWYVPGDPSTMYWHVHPATLMEKRESYYYDTAGRLDQVKVTFGSSTTTMNPATVPAAATSGGTVEGDFGYDLMGRMTSQADGDFARTITYNTKNQVSQEVGSRQKTSTVISVTTSTYSYGTGTGYMLGAATSVSGATAETNTSTGVVTNSSSTTTNSYIWREGTVQSQISVASTPSGGSTTTYTTDFYYDAMGQLAKTRIADGRPRDVFFTGDENGEVVRRQEVDGTANQDPDERWFRFAGKQLGYRGNLGMHKAEFADYDASVSIRTQEPYNYNPFPFNQTTGTDHSDFGQSYTPINTWSQGSAGGTYTVRTGDTLQSIAGAIYGDSSLWYKIAEANGLGAYAALAEGQTISLPTGVTRNTHNASTFAPYNPSNALGDISPNSLEAPKPMARQHCGWLGLLVVAAVTIAVTALVGPAIIGTAAAPATATVGTGLTAAIGPTGAAIIGGAAAGALGSAAGQLVGMAIGVQDKFSWTGVALGALGGAIGGGAGQIFGDGALAGSQFLGDVARGAASNLATQGIAVATGLQSEFSWAGVAAAGVSAATIGAAMRGLNHTYGEFGADGSWGWESGFNPSLGSLATTSMAGLVASAATRSAIEGSSFGQNLIAGLPDVIGQVVGNALARTVQGDRFSEVEAARDKLASADGGVLPGRWSTMHYDGDTLPDWYTPAGLGTVGGDLPAEIDVTHERPDFFDKVGYFFKDIADGITSRPEWTNWNPFTAQNFDTVTDIVMNAPMAMFGGQSINGLRRGADDFSNLAISGINWVEDRYNSNRDRIGDQPGWGQQDFSVAAGSTILRGLASIPSALAHPVDSVKGGLDSIAHGIDYALVAENTPAHEQIARGYNTVSNMSERQIMTGLGNLSGEVVLLFGPGKFKGPLKFEARSYEISRIHGNSLNYVGDTHVYVIRGADGSLYKVGESTQGVRARDGASIRAEQQARALERETGDFYTTEIRRNFDNKADARAYETRFIQTYERLYGTKPPGNSLYR